MNTTPDRWQGPWQGPWRSPRQSPWQRFYGWAHDRRRRYWTARSESLGRPTVSIGNLHWGGSGKTPTVIAAARGIGDGPSAAGNSGAGFRVAVLSRGYGRRGSAPLVVSLGERPLATVEEAGDEPLMIAEQAPGVAVVVGADRRAAAALALSRDSAIDVFILDDAFSHVRVRREVEILTFPASDPFAGGLLPPGGRLREPLDLVRLADAAVLTGLEAGDKPPEDFEPTLRRHGFAGRVFASTLRAEVVPAGVIPARVIPAGGAQGDVVRTKSRKGCTSWRSSRMGVVQPEVTAESSPGRPLLVTGIAGPERVARTAEAAGLECVDHLSFPDHHRYPRRSLRAIEAACARNRCDAVVATSKDAVKLRGRLSVHAPPLLELRVETQTDSGFLPWLAKQLGA